MDINYTIGLDVGEVSVGWAVIDNDNKEILDLGVRCWNKSEDRMGNPLARERREYRGRRKTTRRKAHRKERLKNCIVSHKLLTKSEIINLYERAFEKDIYELRVEALERLLSNEDLARILIKLSKARGFKSNRKSDKESEGAINNAISENKLLMEQKGYKTVGQMLFLDEKFKDSKRNIDGNYLCTVSREQIISEVKLILETQSKRGNEKITDNFINEVIDIIEKQRHFASGDMIKNMVGNCIFEKDTIRAPKATYSFSEFQLYQSLNNLRLINKEGLKIALHEEQRILIADKIFSSSGKYTYKQLRKLLKLDNSILFNKVKYDEDIDKAEKETFINIEEFIKINKALKEYKLTNEILDEIGVALSFYKTDEDIVNELKKIDLDEDIIKKVLEINLKSSKPCHLSLKAFRKINEGLKEGYLYNEACEKCGYDFKGQGKEEDKQVLLPLIPKDEITNPVVFKALIEARNVVNKIIEKYGSPISINIELTRELGRSKKAKLEIAKSQKANKSTKDNIIAEILKNRPDVTISSTQVMKMRLLQEQENRCMYSNKYMDYELVLFDETYCQIDHILPYSRSFDNSYNNKVLVLTKENQEKKDKTPYEFYGESQRWDEFEVIVSNSKLLSYKKKLNLLNKLFKDNEKGFLERNLNNTSYITTFFSKYIRNNLKFKESDIKNKVMCVNGSITSNVRYHIGLEKDRDENIHHAVDAAIVGVVNASYIQQVTNHYKKREDNRVLAKKESPKFPRPWDNFEYELEYKSKEIMISIPEKIKYSGSAHNDTIYSYKGVNEQGYHIIGENVDVSKLSLDKGDKIGAGNSGKMDESHPLYSIIYEALKNKEDLSALKTPSKTGKGNSIKKVMVYRYSGSGNITILNNGKSAKLGGDIIRTDVFEKEGKYYFVPIYASDIVKKEIPNKIMSRKRPRKYWLEADESYNFKFSMYKNTLVNIKIKKQKGITEEVWGYAVPGIDVSEIRFSIKERNKNKELRVNVGTIINLEKYSVDVLGNIELVKTEDRKEISMKVREKKVPVYQ